MIKPFCMEISTANIEYIVRNERRRIGREKQDEYELTIQTAKKSRGNWKFILTADTTMILFQCFAFWLKLEKELRAQKKGRHDMHTTPSDSSGSGGGGGDDNKSLGTLFFNRFGKLISYCHSLSVLDYCSLFYIIRVNPLLRFDYVL